MGETADTLRDYDGDESSGTLRGYSIDDAPQAAWTATAGQTDTGTATDEESGVTDETLEIRAGIEQTRSEMSATIDAIQERLNPQNIVEQAKETVREATVGMVEQAKETVREATVGRVEHMVSEVTDTARDTGNNVIDMIQQNPIPAAAIGLGLGWLLTRGGGDEGNGSNAYRPSERDWNRAEGQGAGRYQATPTWNAGGGYNGSQDRNYGSQGSNYTAQYSNNRSQGQNPISQVVDTIRQNPIPAALAGLGLWLLANRSGGSSGNSTHSAAYYGSNSGPGALEQARDRAGDVAEQAKDTVGSAAEQARDTAGHVVSDVQSTIGHVVSDVQDTAGHVVSGVQDTAGHVVSGAQDKVGDIASETQHRAYQAKTQLHRMMEESPMMIGILAAAVGAAVGLALPETPQEHQLMGQARDTLLDRAQEVAQTTIQKVQEVASAAQDTVRQEVEAQGLTV